MSYKVLNKPIPNSPHRKLSVPVDYQDLPECSLTGLEQGFERDFPGTLKTLRMKDGVVVIRQVYGAVQTLHEPGKCLREYGLQIIATDSEVDLRGRQWRVLTARNRKNHLQVRSIIIDPETDQSWSSARSWFLSACLDSQQKRYLAITEIMDATPEVGFY